MKYEKSIKLKNNALCILKSPEAVDAKAVLNHLVLSAKETMYMARHADEILMTVAQEELYLQTMIDNPRTVMIAAYLEGEIVGVAGVHPVAPYEKYRHRSEYGISVLQAHWGQGIGFALTQGIIESAKLMGYEQVELEVVSENSAAVALYEKCGFKRYGTRPFSFKERDGSYASLDLMLMRL